MVHGKENVVYFIDGSGGTGRTFFYQMILETLRKDGYTARATATSRIATRMLPGEPTTHSKFKILIYCDSSSMCLISNQGYLAQLLRRGTDLIRDKATMTHRHAI